MNKKIIIITALILWGVFMTKTARGERNNNPGNLKKTSDKWQGLSDVQSDPLFFVFDSPLYGIRAMTKLLINYNRLYGLNTVQGIISRYAPGSENDTENYIAFVANELNLEPTEPFPVASENLFYLVRAIIRYENGKDLYSDALIREGMSLV